VESMPAGFVSRGFAYEWGRTRLGCVAACAAARGATSAGRLRSPAVVTGSRGSPRAQEVYFGNHFALEGKSRKKSDICRCGPTLA
jgi:hypothetical protein